MPGVTVSEPGRKIGSNAALFFRRWLANPLQMGSVVPSSPALCRRIAALVTQGPGEAVLELGAGTGVVSRALLDAGVPPERLLVLEIVPDMAEHLGRTLPGMPSTSAKSCRAAGMGGSAQRFAASPWCCCRSRSNGGSWRRWKP